MVSYAEFAEKSLNISRYLVIITAIVACISTAATSITLVGILIFWLLSGQSLITLKTSYQHPVGKTILLFFGWLLIGACYADNTWAAKLMTLLSWQKLFFVFILLGFFYLPEWQQRFVDWYVKAMFAASLFASGLWLLNLDLFGKSAGIFMTNYMTQSMAFTAALLACLFLAQQTDNPKQRNYLWLACALFLLNIFLISPARSGYLAVPPAILFAGVVIYGRRKLPQIMAAVLGILLVASLSSPKLQERIKLGIEEQAGYQSSENLTSIGTRMIFYINTLELIKEKPIFGYGTSAFGKTYSQYVAAKYQDWRSTPSTDPHNQYLFVWLENGLIGVALLGVYIYTAIRQGLRHKPYGPLAASFLVAICASSFFNSHFKTFAEGNLLAFFLGALLALPPTQTKTDC